MTAFSTDDADFRQFASFDRPVQPPSTQVDAIRQSVESRHPERLTLVESPVPARGSLVVSPTVSPRDSGRHSPRLRMAAAILVVISLFGTIFALNRPSGEDTRNNLAFQPSAELPEDVNNAGSAGGSWVVGDADPAMTTAIELSSVTGEQVGFDPARIRGIIVGDSYIFPTFGTKPFIHRSDINGTSLAWSVPIEALSNIVSDGRYVYVQGAAFIDDPSSRFLVAISIETGAVMWQVAGVATPELWTTSLLISDGVLYVANTAGEVMAVNPGDGTVRWYTSIEGDEIAGDDMSVRNPAAPFMALGADGLFVVRSDQSVIRLDPPTGEETGSIDVPEVLGSPAIMTIPQVRGNSLALLVARLNAGEGNETPITVLTADANTLTIGHQVDFPDLRGGNMVLTGDAVYVPVAESATAPAVLARIDLATGEIIQPFGDVTSRALLFPSVSGDTLLVVASDSRDVTFADRHTGELVATVKTGVRSASGAFFSMPLQVWNGMPIAIDGLGVVHLVVDNPGSVPLATPVADATPVT